MRLLTQTVGHCILASAALALCLAPSAAHASPEIYRCADVETWRPDGSLAEPSRQIVFIKADAGAVSILQRDHLVSETVVPTATQLSWSAYDERIKARRSYRIDFPSLAFSADTSTGWTFKGQCRRAPELPPIVTLSCTWYEVRRYVKGKMEVGPYRWPRFKTMQLELTEDIGEVKYWDVDRGAIFDAETVTWKSQVSTLVLNRATGELIDRWTNEEEVARCVEIPAN